MALLVFIMAFVPYLPIPEKIYGAVSFGEGEIVYSSELVSVWDHLAAQEGMERTDFVGHMTRTYPYPGIIIYKQQTSVSPGGRWADYEYRNMYCIAHSRELQENPDMNMETTAVWYMKKKPYTLQDLPEFIRENTADEYAWRLNFLIMAYGANQEAAQDGVNSDPVIGTANYYLCQSLCTLSEKAEFTGDYSHDWEIYREHAGNVAERYHPSELGSSQVYHDMNAKMEQTFSVVWHTAKLAAECRESSDEGFIFRPRVTREADGMYHARYPLDQETREILSAAAIQLYGDWSYEFQEDSIDFKSQTGKIPEEGFLAGLNLDNANGIIRRHIGKESVREVHMPVKVGNQWSLTFAQGNLISCLEEGLQIFVGSPSEEAFDAGDSLSTLSVKRYKHQERWQADYIVALQKRDAETGEPLAGAWFDILEAFDERQLEGSVLEDDNWDNDQGSQFFRWESWDGSYGQNEGGDSCQKDQEVTGEDGWLREMSSLGAGELQPVGESVHRDVKYYTYTKGYCGGHPKPDTEDEDEEEEYQRQVEICERLSAAGGFYHSLDGKAEEWLREDRDRHYQQFVSLVYDYSARELAARKGYILHNQEKIHEPYDNSFDGIHRDTVPIETVAVHSSQYYDLNRNRRPMVLSEIKLSVPRTTAGIAKATASDADLTEDLRIIDEDECAEESDGQGQSATASDAVRILPGIVRRQIKENDARAERIKTGRNDRKAIQIKNEVNFQPSPIEKISPADSEYSGRGGKAWIFEVYDYRTEGEIHINKRDLQLKAGENNNYSSYGDDQGDGTLEGAVYGLFAAEDLVHPDGRSGVVFEEGNLVSVAATDKHGEASFMAVTEPPGTIYDFKTGTTKKTEFDGPPNKYIETSHKYTSNKNIKDNDRWYYPVFDNQSANGNCWIGRPLFLGSYYVQELSRSEGYEMSVYGAQAEVSNRNSWLAGRNGQTAGTVRVDKVKGVFQKAEDEGREETVTEISLISEKTRYGYDIMVKNADPAKEPSFHLTEKGKKEVYREWDETEIVREPVLAALGTQVILNGKSVEAQEGDVINLPNGNSAVVNQVQKIAVTPENVRITGEKGVIKMLDVQYIPELTGIEGSLTEQFIGNCNQAFAQIGLRDVGKDAPYWLVELGEDRHFWGQKLYSFLEKEDRAAFNGARLETVIEREGKSYGVLRYSFLGADGPLPIVYSATDQIFYVKYPVSYSDGTSGYLYRGYPLAEVSKEYDEQKEGCFRWVEVPNVGPEASNVQLYEDLSVLSYKNKQEFKSYWVYGAGEFLRTDDGGIYQREEIRYKKNSGYQTVETTEYIRLNAEYEENTHTWRIHVAQEHIPADGKILVTLRYGHRFADLPAGGGGGISVTAAPCRDWGENYSKPVTLVYPGQFAVSEDGGTRQKPVELLERAIVQKIRISKSINKDSYYQVNTYGEIHEDWFTQWFGGYKKEHRKAAAAERIDNFRFKIYLKSNLVRLYRTEEGKIVWQDRSGAEQEDRQAKKENQVFPGLVRKIFTKVLHRTNILCYNSQDAVLANGQLYDFTGGLINEKPNSGYSSVLEIIEDGGENTGEKTKVRYNYEKFFAALETANQDKWDDGKPSYTSFRPVGNLPNRTGDALLNAAVSDRVRQFAIDWYLDEEVKKLQEESVSYSDEQLDKAMRAATIKAENYLIPFFAYDLDEIYAIAWDSEENGGSDGDSCTLSADTLSGDEKYYLGTSAYLPYGTYVIAEQQPQYAGDEYGKNFKDFKNKHYEKAAPCEVVLPSLPEFVENSYIYDCSMTMEEMEQKYHIRFGEENHVIQAHNHQGDFQIYKFGLSISQIKNGVPPSLGKGDYFALTQSPYKPLKNYYNKEDDRTAGKADFYLAEGKSGREGISSYYRYSSVSEDKKTASGGQYGSMLVPWSIVAEEGAAEKDPDTGESSYKGFCPVGFDNHFFAARLRLEKLDSETHENLLHDGAIFAVYAAKREDSQGGSGCVAFYEKDTVISGSREFLVSMGARNIQPVYPGEGELCTGIVLAGTPICEESEKIIFDGAENGQRALFCSQSTVLDHQTVGYLVTAQPLGAGVYVVAEEKPPYGYVRSRPVAVEIYSDKITYYREGKRDSRVLAAVYSDAAYSAAVYSGAVYSGAAYSGAAYSYKEDIDDGKQEKAEGGDEDERTNQGYTARVYIENTPIKLTVEKKKETNKTLTYKVSGRIDGSLEDIGNNPAYEYAYDGGTYLGYAWKKGTREYLESRQKAGEQVELVFKGNIFAGYGYVTRTLMLADDENPYVAGARLALFDGILLNSTGDTQDHAFEGLVVERNDANNVTRMYVKEGYGGGKTDLIKTEEGVWTAIVQPRPDTDILYYDLGGLEIFSTEMIEGRNVVFGFDKNHRKVPRTESSLFAFKGGVPYLEFVGEDLTKLSYSAKDKVLTIGKDTLVYHLDREGNRDSLTDPYTGMAYVNRREGFSADNEGAGGIMVWPVHIQKDSYGNVIARDKILTSRIATIGENQSSDENSGEESGFLTGSWKAGGDGQSHRKITIPFSSSEKNRDGEMLIDQNNGNVEKQMAPVIDQHGLPRYYPKSSGIYNKGTVLFDRNGDFVRYKDSDGLNQYNRNAYHMYSQSQLYDGKLLQEDQSQEKLYHRLGEAYILENVWITSDKTPNDPFSYEMTDGQPDILKRVAAGNYIMEEWESPEGYRKAMPVAVVVGEDISMHKAFMEDKVIKAEISKVDGSDGQKIGVFAIDQGKPAEQIGNITEGAGTYTHGLVAGAKLALFEAKKVYSADAKKGYKLVKTTNEPFTYEITDSRAGKRQERQAVWVSGHQPIYLEGIPAGTYLLEEVFTPEGFVASEPVELEITGTEDVQLAVMYNDHTKVEMEKYMLEQGEKKQLAGAGFTLYEAQTDHLGEVIWKEGKPQYDEEKAADTWVSSDMQEYSGFIPAFEEMYRTHEGKSGMAEGGTAIAWEANGQASTASLKEISPEGGMIFCTDNGKFIRVSIYGERENRQGKTGDFEYQFDYKKMPWINSRAVSYVTLDGVRRFNFLPAGKKYVLVETTVPRGYAKSSDQVITVPEARDVWRYSTENREGRLAVSKTAEGRNGELAGGRMELYRAGADGECIKDEEHLVAGWVTGSDGAYTRQDFSRGAIPQGYKPGDLKPHEITGLPDGIYWLFEEESPDYYTRIAPVCIDYHVEDEFRVICVEDQMAVGKVVVKKTDQENCPLEGVLFELAAYRPNDRKNPVFTRTLCDRKGIVQADGLPVGEQGEDGRISPYLYRLKEITPPKGFSASTQIFTWSFAPDKEGVSYDNGESASYEINVANDKTRIFVGKKSFGHLKGPEEGGVFLDGAELELYVIEGRDEQDCIVYKKDKPWATWTTTKDKEYLLEGLEAGRSYLLVERKAPKGYQLMEPLIFTLSADGRRICSITNQINTLEANYRSSDQDESREIESVTVRGRYAVRTEYEMRDDLGNVVAGWLGSRDGYNGKKEDGLEEGKLYTITEKTIYSDGTEKIARRYTEVWRYGDNDEKHIPGREAGRVELKLSRADGTVVDWFSPNEAIQEKTIVNTVSPENPKIVLQNRNHSAGEGLDSRQAVFGSVTCVNDSLTAADMSLTVRLNPDTVIIDSGIGIVSGDYLVYQEDHVLPQESREFSFAFEAGEDELSVQAEAVLQYGENTVTSVKQMPVRQKGKLTLYHELTGSGKELFGGEESRFVIWLYRDNGEELKGRYGYEGSKTGFLRSGDSITLAGDEFITIDPGVYQNVRYRIIQISGGKDTTEANVQGQIRTEGSCAVFSCEVSDTSRRQLFKKGESYILTEDTYYSDGTVQETDRLDITLNEKADLVGVAAADRKTRVIFSKINKADGQQLPGNQLAVRDLQGKEIISWISGEQSYVAEGLLSAGEMYVLEERLPAGGFAQAEEMVFTVSRDSMEDIVVLENGPTRAEIDKRDGASGKYLSGAYLQIEDCQGTVMEQWISGTEAYKVTGKLKAGETYYLCETKAPEGYQKAEKTEFRMPWGEEKIILVLNNRKEEGEEPDRPDKPKEPQIPDAVSHRDRQNGPGQEKNVGKTGKENQNPAGDKKVGWISARYTAEVPLNGEKFFDGHPEEVLTLVPAGDRSLVRLYRMLWLMSVTGMIVILAAIREKIFCNFSISDR